MLPSNQCPTTLSECENTVYHRLTTIGNVWLTAGLSPLKTTARLLRPSMSAMTSGKPAGRSSCDRRKQVSVLSKTRILTKLHLDITVTLPSKHQ